MKLTCILLTTLSTSLILSCAAFQIAQIQRSYKFETDKSIQSSPASLCVSRSDTMEGLKPRLFVDHFGCTPESLSRLLPEYQYNSIAYSELEARANWLQHRLSLTETEMKRLVQQYPIILACKPETNLEPTLQYLQTRLELNTAKLRAMVNKTPQLLGLSIEANVEPKLCYLENQLQLNKTQVGKIIFNHPTILNLNVEEKLEPNIAWLRERLDLNRAEVSKIVRRFPNLLYLSISDNIEPNLDWLKQRLDLSNSQARKIVMRLPQILASSVENKMEPTLKWLQKRLLLKNNTELSNVIERLPTLLGCSIQTNLQPTLDFCIEAVGDEVAITILKKDPRIFSSSLEKRLKPRLKEAKRVGFTINGGCLSRIAKYTDIRWIASIDNQSRKDQKLEYEMLKEKLW